MEYTSLKQGEETVKHKRNKLIITLKQTKW